jgi:signal transduction histidine kinase
VELAQGHSVDVNLEGLLAKAKGVLLNISEKDGQARLLIQTRVSAFEAALQSEQGDSAKRLDALKLGSQLALTGAYEVQSDEHAQPRAFLLRLRSAQDVQVLKEPPWWTLARLLWVLLGLLAVLLVAIAWSILISHKNTLLRQAQGDLRVANDELEERVEARTRELREQVAAREQAHAELARAQETVILTSRRAGMAEVATSVLHNVGNVLTSVNVSASLVADRLKESKVANLSKVAALLHEHETDLGAFLNGDPKGKHLSGYLGELAKHLTSEQSALLKEMDLVRMNIDHIKDIVTMQQSYARVAGVVETVEVSDLVEDSLRLNAGALSRHGIEVNACDEAERTNKRVTLRVSSAHERVRIAVVDNGVGIPRENLTRIFNHGFTTRKNGHGFGLHSGALAAQELGGTLTVHSEGPNQGATFTLELPLHQQP